MKNQEIISELRNKFSDDEKIVYVSGLFNIVHPGHLRLLRFAAECGDRLVVGVYPDSESTKSLSKELRLENVLSVAWVDHAFVLEDTPENFIAEYQPDVVVKGKEHEQRHNPEQPIVENYGGKLLFSSGDISFSSIDLLRDEVERLHSPSIVLPEDYLQRHEFTVTDMLDTLEEMKKLNVIVIGDVIVDEYITCDPVGMSQEDPTIVITPLFEKRFIGGAGIVAAHAGGLGANVNFFTIGGEDREADFVNEKLEEYGVNAHMFVDESRRTPLKQRFRASEKTLLRVNHVRQHDCGPKVQQKLLEGIRGKIRNADLLIFSDFNYGCLPQDLVESIGRLCEEYNVPMVADSQSSSQIGDVGRFKKMLLLTPTEREARLALRDFSAGIPVLVDELKEKTDSKNVFLTLGKEGVVIHAVNSESNWLTDKLPAMNSQPKDPAGAGDSFLTASSMALATRCNVWSGAYLGSIAAACQVGRLGNIPIGTEDIVEEIRRGLLYERNI